MSEATEEDCEKFGVRAIKICVEQIDTPAYITVAEVIIEKLISLKKPIKGFQVLLLHAAKRALAISNIDLLVLCAEGLVEHKSILSNNEVLCFVKLLKYGYKSTSSLPECWDTTLAIIEVIHTL